MSDSQSTVRISPYVAAAIIEHGKRRSIAAGFVLGERTSDEVRVLDYFPLTHVEQLADVKTQAYKDEVDNGKRTKSLFTTAKVLGWYSAGNCPEEITEEQFRIWCELPAVRFVHNIAIHIHCALPEQDKLSVSWSAARMRTYKEEGKTKFDCRTEREATLPVSISAMGDVPSNVFLEHVANNALFGGKKPYPTSDLLNLDYVALRASKLPMPRLPPLTQQPGKEEQMPPRPIEESLIRVHDKLLDTIRNATAASKNGGANLSEDEKKAYEEVLANLDVIRRTREAELEQQHNATSREDVSTQRFKDAIMIKCMALMLRRDVRQIEHLAQDNSNRGANKNREVQSNQNINNRMARAN